MRTHTMKKIATYASVLALAGGLSACGGDDNDGGSSASSTAEGSGAAAKIDGKVGVILPDATSSPRWESFDRKYLAASFDAAGVQYDIQNANGDKQKFATIADQMINGGVTVLALTNLDSPSAATVIKKAKNQGIPVIDYDRLTLGGGADYYVSFDNVAVGSRIGEGLVTCMKDNGQSTGNVALLNGSPTDNNATLFKQGYEKAIKDAGYTVAADQSVPDWDPTKGGTIFEQMFSKNKGDFVGVAAANDGLGGAVAAVLSRNGDTDKIPTTGQDATVEGLQRVLTGGQCMTVYKAVKKEADAAAKLAVALLKKDQAGADALASGKTTDSESNAEVPSVLLEPQAIFPKDVKTVVSDGFVKASDLCTTAKLKKACDAQGISGS